jgi:hypothetical protein
VETDHFGRGPDVGVAYDTIVDFVEIPSINDKWSFSRLSVPGPDDDRVRFSYCSDDRNLACGSTVVNSVADHRNRYGGVPLFAFTAFW